MAQAAADPGRISDNRLDARFDLSGQTITITRDGARCPPACVQPIQAAQGIATLGELELLDFLEDAVSAGRGLLVDARRPDGFAAATLPGAVNVPAETLDSANPYRDDLLAALGARDGDDFSDAFDLAVFAGGPDDPASTMALRHLLDAGYPANKLTYYRGGMSSWMSLGLTTVTGR
ncbi:rhodanese-like domain-containing protein [Thalassococcus sp. CAU 1522]|uniref:Rhodanese-like domain-containing protein n=1 Tax=Thalassococcus arenae TaxID=2851652 RepID=A0ABS6N5B5_9RHOB|nr:rhodanese-like domain-containing protein [Thalassococcus arenae]MBV2359198.1 rhodanese-like domain-containing protein [Thalassococcus arenae]